MKRITRIVLKVVHDLKLGGFFASLSPSFHFLKKFVPHPSFYNKNDEITVKRDLATFRINRSDWMQWHIFARFKDDSWKIAVKALEKVKKNKLVILDIGSNVGAFSFKLANRLLKKGITDFVIHSFDPNPYIKERFATNLSLNPAVQKNIFFYPLALSDFKGTASFNFARENSGGGSISDKGIPVTVTTIDSFCTEQRIDEVNFIKIDVEGFEPFVFDGAKKILESCRPVIYTEISPLLYESKKRSAKEILEYLFEKEYELHKDDGRRLKLIEPKNVDSFSKEFQFNVLAVPF